MTVQSCLGLFEKDGVARPVAGNHPLVLNDPQTVCLVGSGRVDVFAVPFKDNEPTGARVHLFRADPGQILFGIALSPEDQVGLVAVGTPGSDVFCLPQSRLRELTGDPALAARVAASLDQWIDGLTASVARRRPPRQVAQLEPGVGLHYEAETILCPGQGILWVSGSQGAGRFLGRQELLLTSPDALFPLSCSGWLTVEEPTTLAAARTESLLGEPRLWASLERFQSAVLSYVSLNVAEDSAAERERLHRKSKSETQLIQGAVSQLAAAVEREELAGPLVVSDQDPLLAACQLVGRRMGITVKAPPGWGEKTRSDPVPAIARASGVRTRRVILADDWWRQDNGPLLAFRAEDDRPVALWPTSRSSYELLDPVERSRTAVTPANASSLRAQGYCFYRSFAARALTVRHVVQFGLVGTGRDWLTVILLGLMGGLLGYLTPLAMVLIFGQIIPESDQQRLLLLVLALVASAVAGGLFQFSQGVAMLRLETQMDSAVEAGVWDRLLKLPASFFRQYTAGDLAVRAMGISRIRQVLTQAALSSLFSFLFSLLSFALLYCFDGRLAALATVVFVIVAAVACSAALVQLRFERQSWDVRGRVAGLVLQLLTGISRLRVAGAENRALAIWAKDFSRQTRLAFQAQSVANGLAAFTGAVPILASMVIFAAVTLLPGAVLSMPTFLAFNATFVGIIFAAVAMSSVVTSILQIVPLYERAKPILETLPESHAAQHDPGDLSGDIEISHVSFRYHSDTPWILDDVSMHIRPGEFVAFVGPSGAGKSTILRLLLGFETPNAGSVYYDRGDLVGLDQQAVRRQIGAVLHSSRLTSGDILSNITGGSPAYTLEDAWEAARLSGLEEDIKRMPMGMYTAIAEGEGTLSGGQRQRLMIARAIIAKPRILLFDEATSALDNVTQAKVAQSLTGLKATRVVVAHRLSTVMSADRIYVIDRGKVVQMGTFDELIQQPGMFAELAKRQLLS